MSAVKIKLLIILSVLVLLFGLWNIVWFIMTNNRYEAFLSAVPESKHDNHVIEKNGYVYSVKRPGYLSFTGNLAIISSEYKETLIIWPLMDGSYEYGIRVQKDGQVHELTLDEQLRPIDPNDSRIASLVADLEPQINALYKKATDMWDLQ